MKPSGDKIQTTWWLGKGLTSQLFRGGAGSLLTRATEVVLTLAVAVLLARLLGASGYGVYALVFAMASIAVMPAQAGLPPLVVRETARGQRTGDWSAVRGIWRWSNTLALSLSVLILVGGTLGLWLDWPQGEALREPIVWALGLIPLTALLAIRSASLRGLRHMMAGLIPELVIRPALLTGSLLAVWLLYKSTITPGEAMALTVASTLVAFAVGAWLLRHYRPPEITTARPHYQHKAWLTAAWPMALTQGFEKINRYADVLLLGLLAATVDVGVYRVAAQGAMLVSLGLVALNIVIAPYAVRLHTEQAQRQLQKLVQRTSLAALIVAVPATLFFFVLGEWLLITLFGDEFRSAYWPMLILSGGQLVNAWFGPPGLLLTMTGYEREVARTAAVTAGVNIVLNILLIPPLDATGAAIATSISLAFWKVWLWKIAKKRLGIRCSAI